MKVAQIITLFFGVLGFTACGSNSGSGSSSGLSSGYRPVPTAITLEDARDSAGCFNVQKYFDILKRIEPATVVQKITLDFAATSKEPIRRNFLLSTAYRMFQFQEVPMSQIDEAMPIEQIGCQNVKFDDHTSFQVVSSTSESIVMKNEHGDMHIYHWQSPTMLRIEDRYKTNDFGCNEKPSITVRSTRIIRWGQAQPLMESMIDVSLISEDYLNLVTEAVGTTLEINPETPTLISGLQLMQLPLLPARPELVQCTI